MKNRGAIEGSHEEGAAVGLKQGEDCRPGVSLARLIVQYFSGAEFIEFCICQPPREECSTGLCGRVRVVSRKDVEAFLRPNSSATKSPRRSLVSTSLLSPISSSSSPLIGIRAPDWSLRTLLEAGDFAAAAELARAVSDWKNFLFLACCGYALTSIGRRGGVGDDEESADGRGCHRPTYCRRRVERRLRRLVKSVLHALLNHCLSPRSSTTTFAPADRRQQRPGNPDVDIKCVSNRSSGHGECHDTDDDASLNRSQDGGVNNKLDDARDATMDPVRWGPVDDSSTLRRKTRLDELLHTGAGHKFVTRLAAMFGVDLVTFGFRKLVGRLYDVVQKLDFTVPDELHLPLPPLFASGTHLNMVVVRDDDETSAKEVDRRRKISRLCHQILAHLDQANCLVPCLLPLVQISAQIRSDDCSQKADVSAILKTGSRIGVHSFDGMSARGRNPTEVAVAEAIEEGMSSVTDCFDELTSLLWFLSARDRLSAAWQRYRRWKSSSTLTILRRGRDDESSTSASASTEAALSVTSELLESCSQYLQALDLTALFDSNPGVHHWWQQDCRQIFLDTSSDWLESSRPVAPLRNRSPGFKKLVLTDRKRPEWVKTWLNRSQTLKEAVGNASEASKKDGKATRINSDYLRFLSLFVEMAMTDVGKMNDGDPAYSGRSPNKWANSSVSAAIIVPSLPCFGRVLRRDAASTVDSNDLADETSSSLSLIGNGSPSLGNQRNELRTAEETVGKSKMKFLLWLQRWAQDSEPFCKCTSPFERQSGELMKNQRTGGDARKNCCGIRLKLNLPTKTLIKAVLNHPNVLIRRKLAASSIGNSALRDESNANKRQGFGNRIEDGFGQSSKMSDERDRGRGLAAKKLPQYYFGSSPEHISSTSTDESRRDEFSIVGPVAGTRDKVVEGKLSLRTPIAAPKERTNYRHFETTTDNGKRDKNKGWMAERGSLLLKNKNMFDATRQVALPDPQKSDFVLRNEVTKNFPSPSADSSSTSLQRNATYDVVTSPGCRKSTSASPAVDSCQNFRQAQHCKIIPVPPKLSVGDEVDDDDDSVDLFYPKSSENRICCDASSDIRRQNNNPPADSDDTLKDFTLPSSSEAVAVGPDANDAAAVASAARKPTSDEGGNAVNNLQQKLSRKNGSSVSSFVKRIFKAGLRGRNLVPRRRTDEHEATAASEGEELPHESCLSEKSASMNGTRFRIPPLLHLRGITDGGSGDDEAVSASSSDQHCRHPLRSLDVVQTQVVRKVLKKVECSLRLAAKLRQLGHLATHQPVDGHGGNGKLGKTAQKFISLPLLRIPAHRRAILQQKDESENDDNSTRNGRPATADVKQPKPSREKESRAADEKATQTCKKPMVGDGEQNPETDKFTGEGSRKKNMTSRRENVIKAEKATATVVEMASQTSIGDVEANIQTDDLNFLEDLQFHVDTSKGGNGVDPDDEYVLGTRRQTSYHAAVGVSSTSQLIRKIHRSDHSDELGSFCDKPRPETKDAEAQVHHHAAPLSERTKLTLRRLVSRRRRRITRALHASIVIQQQQHQRAQEDLQEDFRPGLISTHDFAVTDTDFETDYQPTVEQQGDNFRLVLQHEDEDVRIPGGRHLLERTRREPERTCTHREEPAASGIFASEDTTNEIRSLKDRKPDPEFNISADEELRVLDESHETDRISGTPKISGADESRAKSSPNITTGRRAKKVTFEPELENREQPSSTGGSRYSEEDGGLWDAILNAESAAYDISKELRSSEILLTAIEHLADTLPN